MTQKKKVLYHSDFSLLRTGFGKVARLVLSYLYKTGKYDIVHYCCGLGDQNDSYQKVPWKNVGAMPSDPSQIENIKRDPKLTQLASYGAMTIDDVMAREKPDIYIGVQDIWGVEFATKKPWWTNDNMAIWTTLDSLPILPMAVSTAESVKNFWCWSDFATEGLNKLGHDHVKTLRGPLDHNNFHKLSTKDKRRLKKRAQINNDTFVIGFVFRNQLRKSVPNLLEGYKLFLENNPEAKGEKSKLLLHTNFSEGWDIQKLSKEYGITNREILTTYVCGECGAYGVHHFSGQSGTCPKCHKKDSYKTTGIQGGVSEEQLNEVYNLMDVYCHPFTSGGQEIPIQEAKLTELITLVTNYSCGVDSCKEEAASLPLDWSEYREHGTEFIKASTDPKSIAEQLEKVYKMSEDEKNDLGKRGRDWVINNFSVTKVCKQLEDFIDNCKVLDKEKVYSENNKSNNPNAQIDLTLPNEKLVVSLYKSVLDMEVNESDQGYQYWMKELSKGVPRETVVKFFRSTATKELSKSKTIEDMIDKDDGGKRILYVIPQKDADVFLSTSLFKSASELYPEHKLYVATLDNLKSLIEPNPYVYKVIDFLPEMNDPYNLECYNNRSSNNPDKKKLFDVVLLSNITSQLLPSYTRNGLDKISFDLKSQ